MSGRRDLGLAAAAAIACAALAVALPWEVPRLVVAMPLAFFLPGYAIVAGFGPRPLDPPQSIMLWLGCSLSVLCLGGLLLNYTPGGIQTAPWAILLALVVLVGCGAALYRRGREDWEPASPGRRTWRPRSVDVILGALAVALAVGAVVLANTPLKADGAAGYTSLWINPATGAKHGVQLGVASAEHGRESYVLMVKLGAGRKQVVSRFSLRPDDEHTFAVTFPAPRRGSTLVEGLLYRRSSPAKPLRHVRLWLPAEAKKGGPG